MSKEEKDNPNRCRIFIGRVNPEARTRDLEKFLSTNGFSRIRDINMKLGYAFVEFEDKRDADDAVYDLDRKEFFGSKLTVEHARNSPRGPDKDRFDDREREKDRVRESYRVRERGHGRPYNTEWRLIVENLSSRVGWQDLKDLFRAAGEVTFTKANKEKVGEGVVEFRSYREMKNAIKMFDNSEFFGRRIKCIDDSPGPPKESDSRSRSRSRSRRSRSRSGSNRRSRTRTSAKRSKSPSRSKSRSKSASRSRSHSKSPAKDQSPGGKSRSPSPDRDQGRGEDV